MQVSVFDGATHLWARSEQGGIASIEYLSDGTQHRIVAALRAALFQAEAELRSSHNLKRMTDGCCSAAEIDDNVPVSGSRDRDPRRQPFVEPAVVFITPAGFEQQEVFVIQKADIALMRAVNDGDVASA